MAIAQTYPVQLELDAPLKVARWRPFVHWIMAIPHFVVMYILNAAGGVVTFIAWWAILFTGKYPEGLFNFEVMVQRYQWHVISFLTFTREPYPAFEFSASATDPGTDPARYSVQYPEKSSRLLLFFRWLLLIPHLIVLVVLFFVMYLVIAIGFLAVLITGGWPEGLRNFVVGFYRWLARVQAYGVMLTDVYPPFSFS